ncbi:MAG: tyrosine-type recombinase/integrase [Rhizobiaceae bacterium]
MRKHHPKNERIKRRYLSYLEEAKRCQAKTTDQVAAALALFEQSTKWKDFAAFHIEQAKAFKSQQYDQRNEKTGKPLAKATVHSRLMHCKAFFLWLAGQPGYRSKISYSDSDYFNPSANDTRIATAKREKRVPTLEQIKRVLETMPDNSVLERRDRAIIAFTLLSGARDDAIASLSVRHVDWNNRRVYQDSRDVRTKNRKTITSCFFPVSVDIETMARNWANELETDHHFGPDDTLFPATEIGLNDNQEFAPVGISRNQWKNASAIRRIFKRAFTSAGLPYFNPHSFRNTLAQLGERLCTTPEQFKAWSQNLGHEQVLTTFTSYGQVSNLRQTEILDALGKCKPDGSRGSKNDTIAEMEAILQRMKAEKAA